MSTRGIAAVCLASAMVTLACGIAATGELASPIEAGDGGSSSSSSGFSSASSSGGAFDGGADVVTTCDSGLAAGAVVLPADGGACPAGTTEQTVKTSPVAGASACSCATCVVTQEGTCAGDNFLWRWGGNNSCNQDSGGQSYNVTADNACVQIFSNNTGLAAYNRWTRTPTGGTCTSAGVGDKAQVTATDVRQCVPDGTTCSVATAPTDQVCVPADADGGACPAAYPTAIVVGDDTKVDCAACGCTRTGACHVEYHDNDTCTSKKYERDADGQCLATNSIQMQRIKVYPQNMACTTTPGAATAGLTNQRTLCCTQ